jgi:dipeptidyl aminopeptidase/acylaminoacyl peptidase
MRHSIGRHFLWLSLLAFIAGTAAADTGENVHADALTVSLLRRPEFEQVAISPGGTRLAVVRRMEKDTVVVIYQRDKMEPINTLTAGKGGEIDSLEWLDDNRILIGAARADGLYGIPLVEPAVSIVDLDAKDRFDLPANFLSTIDGDPEHLLVTSCTHWVDGDCVLEIHRAEIGRLRRLGELVMAAPDSHSNLFADRNGNVRFAIGWDKDDSAKTFVHRNNGPNWELINDSKVSGVVFIPVGVTADNKTGVLQITRESGPDTIESYDFGTGARTPIYSHPSSDPLRHLVAINGSEPIGAVYDATHPVTHFWNPADPDAMVMQDIEKSFPGKQALVVSASRDKSLMVLFVDSDHDPGSFFLLDRSTGKASLLVRSCPWLDPATLGSQSPVTLKSRDGLTLQGLLTLPPGSDGKNLPMVVLPHGGPYGVVDSWGYDAEDQILATHGYAVLQINYRGSGGYGSHFENMGMRQWGRAMQDDVTDATHWAIEQGIADPGRICIYGASYGGYAALMGTIREPTLYQCAAGRAGVYDLSKLYKWGSIHRTDLGKEYLERAIGHDMGELDANSPAKLADKINVPVLLAHGRDDGRVDINHARELKRALGKAGKQVELIEYEYEGHSFVHNDHLQDFYARLLRFFDQHIGNSRLANNSPATSAH